MCASRALALSPPMITATMRRPPRPAEVIADQLRSVSLRYRGWDPQRGRLGEWQAQWRWDEQMRPPQFVAISVQPASGPAWPEMIVAIPQQRPGADP